MSVCPFICPSHAGIVSKPINNIKLFFTVDYPQRYDTIPMQPLTRVSDPGGYKNRNFRPISRFISEMIQDRVTRSYYGMRIGNRTQAFEWYHYSVTLSDLVKYSMTHEASRGLSVQLSLLSDKATDPMKIVFRSLYAVYLLLYVFCFDCNESGDW